MRIPTHGRLITENLSFAGCLAVVGILCGPVPLRAADTPVNTNALKMQVDRLSAAAERTDWAEVDRVQEELKRSGSAALPLLLERMRQDGGSRNAKFHLLDTLRRIPGEQTTETLLDLVLNDKDRELAESAAAAIPDQIVLRRKFSEAEQKKLAAKISDDRIGVAAKWAFLLSRAEQVDNQRVAVPLIERFATAANDNAVKVGVPVYGSDLSRKGGEMLWFLRVFPYLDASTTVPLLKAAMTQAKDQEAKRWWLMALGMTGDKTVGSELRAIVESKTEDVSVRALALMAYGYALEEEALPLLRSYENDPTPGPNPYEPSPLRNRSRSTTAKILGHKLR
jgi:M42 glutamyl aminopeptidase